MTDEQRDEIKRLAVAAHGAENRYRWAGYQNHSRDPVEGAEQAARYALLRAEAGEARCALESAIAALGKPAEPWVGALASEMVKAASRVAI